MQGKEENGRCTGGIGQDPESKVEINRRWINDSKPFCTGEHERSRLPSQIAKCVKDRKLSTTEMRLGVDL